MVYLDGGFRSFLDVFNKARFGRFYQDADYATRRQMYNIWNLPSLNPALAIAPLIHGGLNCRVINNVDSEFDLLLDWAAQMERPLIAISTTFLLEWSVIGRLIKRINAALPDVTWIVGGAFINDQVVTRGLEILEKPLRKYGISYALHSYNSEGDFKALLDGIRDGDLSSVQNLAYLDAAGSYRTSGPTWHPPFIERADIPPWDKINLPQNNRTVQLRSSSGCAFRCSFCTYPVAAQGFHPSEMDYLEAQLDLLAELEIDALVFIDDTPNTPPRRFRKMLALLKQYRFRWYSFLRPQYIDREIARSMKESGCDGVYLGIESANDQVLSNMNKRATRAQYVEGISYLNEFEITTFAAFIIGFPGETREMALDTIRFVEDNSIDFYSLKEFWYSANAPIREDAAKYGLTGFGNNWKHDAMSSDEASAIKHEIFDQVRSCTCLDSDSGLWYLVYLRDQGFDWPTIRQAQALIIEMMRRDGQGRYEEKQDLMRELAGVIAHVPTALEAMPR